MGVGRKKELGNLEEYQQAALLFRINIMKEKKENFEKIYQLLKNDIEVSIVFRNQGKAPLLSIRELNS